MNGNQSIRFNAKHWLATLAIVAALVCVPPSPAQSTSSPSAHPAPAPLLDKGHAVNWWFVFKFNSAKFPACGGATRSCIFGGTVQNYQHYGQQFVYASNENESLQSGKDCLGDTTTDPVGATYDEVYNGTYYYVVWNDQFYDDPEIAGCSKSCGGPWGHSKGLLAWNEDGEGVVLQVSTPSWPGSGSSESPRKADGNSLGCVQDNDVQVSQHFFALKLTKSDVVMVLTALRNASVVTDPKNPQIVKNGGPADIQQLVAQLGAKSVSHEYLVETLSSNVELISKPSDLHVPPWQMVSSLLGGVSLRTATWWAKPQIYSTASSQIPACWDSSLRQTPGAVEIATSGQWANATFGLTGGLGTNFNHAKVGVSTSNGDASTIFGDMNQQGSLDGPNCASSQNGRGGLFYVLKEKKLTQSVTTLLTGGTAPSAPPGR